MFALVVRFELNDAAAAELFDTMVEELLPRIEAREPGTLVYTVHTVEGSPLSRVFYECYRNRAAFDEHEAQSHTQAFLTGRTPLLASLRVEVLHPVGSARPAFRPAAQT